VREAHFPCYTETKLYFRIRIEERCPWKQGCKSSCWATFIWSMTGNPSWAWIPRANNLCWLICFYIGMLLNPANN
jgi:hypothetical protein